MKTVSSICAAGSLTALSAVGLALARPNEGDDDEGDGDSAASTRTRHPTDMAAAVHNPFTRDSPAFAFSTVQQPRRVPSEEDDRRHLADLTVDHKRRRSAASKGGTPGRESEGGRRSGTPSSWMRRLSSNLSSTMSTSRESSRAPTSRPASAVFSYADSNESAGASHSGSTTPVFRPLSRPHNKLVKRTSSAHSTRGSPFDGPSASRLPVLRRPATSHQRSATLQETYMYSSPSQDTRDSSPWRHYFTPRVAATDATARRGSTGIPNPIKRVYPDRKHIPTLISAKELVRPAIVELEGNAREEDFAMFPSTASSPFPSYVPHFEESTAPRRSFSISDLLANRSQPVRTRPSTGKDRPWSSRSLRIARPRVVSEPQASMGTYHSKLAGHEFERPAKRRGIPDPRVSPRSISSPSADHVVLENTEANSSLDSEGHALKLVIDGVRRSGPASRAQTPPLERRQLTSILPTPSVRPARLSASNSEIASISADSDSDARSLGDNSTDYQSDNVNDSFPTRTTRSSSGRRGPHIETIFDESPPSFSSGRSTKLKDFLSDAQYPGGSIGDRYRHSTIEEEDSVVSTPVRSLRNKSITSTPSARPGAPYVFSSSPPTMNVMPDPDEVDWDAPEDGVFDGGLEIRPRDLPYTANGRPSELSLPFRFGPNLQPAYPHSVNTTPHRNGAFSLDKANLFDWAEQQPSPSHASNSPPRPRTVHGKKDQDNRWSRPAGRRGPSAGMHARSHSVPVVPDLGGKRDTAAANKFGTWGVGSKAVTEDWNEDFDFDEPPHLAQTRVSLEEKRIDSGHEMFVPKSIREQQENVVANIGLLREWGLLIEELKELRVRAVGLDMMIGPYQQAWREVDAMIELADQESEEHTLEPRGTPPSSPGFDLSAFEEHTPPRHSPARLFENTPSLPEFAPATKQPSTPQSSTRVTRPRKDSELVAQTVIAALQSRRDIADSTNVQSVGSSKKVPFDTATLRHIVPYVNGLKRRVKDALRETEGLYSSPRRRSSPDPSSHTRENLAGAPAFRGIFKEPQNDITTRRQTRREQAVTDNDGFGSMI